MHLGVGLAPFVHLNAQGRSLWPLPGPKLIWGLLGCRNHILKTAMNRRNFCIVRSSGRTARAARIFFFRDIDRTHRLGKSITLFGLGSRPVATTSGRGTGIVPLPVAELGRKEDEYSEQIS